MTTHVWQRIKDEAKTGITIPCGPATIEVRLRRRVRVTHNWLRQHIPAKWAANALRKPQTIVPLGSSCGELALVIGVGPGVGIAAVRRFAAAGMRVIMVARRVDKLDPFVREVAGTAQGVYAYGCDATSERSVQALVKWVGRHYGVPHLVVYNCEAFAPGGLLETNAHAFRQCWETNCLGAFLAARAALPGMLLRGTGTILFTGPTGSLRGRAGYVNLAVGKSGARMLAQSMAREFGPQGIHVAHVVIDGPVLTPMNDDVVAERGMEGLLNPEAIADTLLALHLQHRTAWTHELDLRPCVEPF